MKIKSLLINLGCLSAILMGGFSCSPRQEYYGVTDFEKVPKIDGHFHYVTMDERYLDFAASLNFKLLSPNVDSKTPIDKQLEIASGITGRNKGRFGFFGTFSVDSFGNTDFASLTIARIRECMQKGATGIKIWKNIGMDLQDEDSNYVMIDNPAFEPVFQYLEENKIPVIAHLGEPKNCWLPADEMTDDGDRNYYENHPRYHMYLHPEMPSYDDQINARNNILVRYPHLDVIGAHLGSLEWDVNELARHLDRFPNMKVDMAARIGHLKNQSAKNRKLVRDFMIKYQDRIIYATDMSANDDLNDNFDKAVARFRRTWLADWIYLATDSATTVDGLQLPKEVIDKIYFGNAAYLISAQ